MTLRGRLLTSFAYLLILTVVVLAVPLAINIQRRARGEFESRLASQTQVIASSIVEPTAAAGRAALEDIVDQYGSSVGARVIVTDEAGRLLADSAGGPLGRGYANRPEIAAALDGDRVRFIRFSEDLDTDLLVTAAPVVDGQEVVGAVRLSEPMREVNLRVQNSWLALAGVSTLVVVVGLVIAWILAYSLSAPLRSLARTAGALGSGDLSARAEEFGPSDVAEVSRELNRMAAEVESTLRSQQDFVANASHQLRTPLTGVRLRLEAIAAEGGAAGRQAAAAMSEVDRLAELVEDLLVLERTARREVAAVPTDLAEVVREAAARWESRIAENRQALHCRIDGDDLRIMADSSDLAQVLDNLIENATVYCPPDATITLESRSVGEDAVISVRDDGPGISERDLPRVFERFYRAPAKAATKGTGLGLAIVKEIVERWDGIVTASSSSEGTEFRLRWARIKSLTNT